jgi:hypothetical protein
MHKPATKCAIWNEVQSSEFRVESPAFRVQGFRVQGCERMIPERHYAENSESVEL